MEGARACSSGEDTAVEKSTGASTERSRLSFADNQHLCFSAQADALSATLSEVESVVALTGQAFAKCLRRSRDRSGRRSPYSDENRPVRIQSERSRSSRGCHLRHGQGGKLHAYAKGAIRFDTEVGASVAGEADSSGKPCAICAPGDTDVVQAPAAGGLLFDPFGCAPLEGFDGADLPFRPGRSCSFDGKSPSSCALLTRT